jgi:cobyric acid synthase CobQ/L-threonine-O-3-phosphate decarboxylase
VGNPVDKTAAHGGNVRALAAKANCAENDLLDFSASINPLGPPQYVRAVISANISKLLHYPDPTYQEFCVAVAAEFALQPAQVLVGNGSTEILYALPRALAVQRAVIPVPSYIGYEEAITAADLAIEHFALHQEKQFGVDWLHLQQSLQGGELVFLGQPNNPTGTIIDLDSLGCAARKNPKTYFIVDEAFIDFVDDSDSAMALTAHLANIIVLRSMTKFYAIPGLRLGFAVAHQETAAKIRTVLPPWSVNCLALTLGAKMISDHAYGAASRALVKKLKNKFTRQLEGLKGLHVFAGQANFLLIKLSQSPLNFKASELADKLLQFGIAVRVCANFAGLDDTYIRLAIRTQAENDQLISALGEVLGQREKGSRARKTPSLMFQGTCSDAGKSIMTAALCRILLQDGVRVAPFKSQNMSLNSFVTHDGCEMGRAQVVQAQASRLDPDVRMNPILLKPSSDVGSQVIVNGRPVGNMTVDEYVRYKPVAFAAAQKAYDSLAADYETIILEGAGSPGEVNLKSHDIVNMRMAEYARSPVLLVGDIDRGGVYASFIGTMEVLAEWERNLLAGFIVNRFRGQESLLADAHRYVALHTGKPVLGVVPYLANLGLPEEDSVGFKKGLYDQPRPVGDCVEIALIDLPHISNFTDFEPFLAEKDVYLRVVKHPHQLETPDVIMLPGSKNVIKDLHYLQAAGFVKRIKELAHAGNVEIVGICGGFQILGREIADPHQIESSGRVCGLELLPISTVLEKEKILTRRHLTHNESNCQVSGYEIHHGQTKSAAAPIFRAAADTDLGAGSGLVWGSYLHGIFDADEFRDWFIERIRSRKKLMPYGEKRPIYDLEPAFDRLAQTVRQRIDMDMVYKLLGL